MTTPRAKLMNHVNEFIRKYNGSKYQESSIFWYQCVALVKLFYKEVIWYSLPSFWWSAIYAWEKTEWKWFTDVNNNLFNYPQVWDVLFWDRWSYGHTAICVRANPFYVTYIEQNWWKGTWTWLWSDSIRVTTSSYKNIVGWRKFNSLDIIPWQKD